MNGLSSKQKLEKLKIVNADKICNFPSLILDDFFEPFRSFFDVGMSHQELEQSHYVLTSYR